MAGAQTCNCAIIAFKGLEFVEISTFLCHIRNVNVIYFYVKCLQYVAEMVGLFGRTTEHLCNKLDIAAHNGVEVEMESLFSRLTLDIIGKAVFNYDFDSLSHDKGLAEVYLVPFIYSFVFPTNLFSEHRENLVNSLHFVL